MLTADEDQQDRLIQALGHALELTVNESVIIAQLEEFFDPRPARIASSQREAKDLETRSEKLQRDLGGAPPFIIQLHGDQIRTYDVYANAVFSELMYNFHRCRRAVSRTHLFYIGLGLSDRYSEYFKSLDKASIPAIKKSVEERFWEHAEIAFIRLASFWDRVGQVLDFVFFNIRQYERDGFASVMDRINCNFVSINSDLGNSSHWQDLWAYKRSEKRDGLAWLIRRRNLLVHSLYLRRLDPGDEYLFNSKFNHLDRSLRTKLKPQEPKTEIQHLHEQLQAAASLIPSVLGLCELGIQLIPRPRI